ncbi:MAG: type II toxin-antitoxin system YafQ family toxin, partial [Acetatifactor sp.]|nr:type II toxin-antitoxin system YafQ family toxin [Acetatifactor sp.]
MQNDITVFQKHWRIWIYEIQISPIRKIKKRLENCKKRGLDISLPDSIVDKLLQGIPLEEKHKDRPLKGNWNGFRECHIQPDWLLIYLIEDDILTLT